MFRETERELMILKEPTTEDRDLPKTISALLIAEGERRRTFVQRVGGLGLM